MKTARDPRLFAGDEAAADETQAPAAPAAISHRARTEARQALNQRWIFAFYALAGVVWGISRAGAPEQLAVVAGVAAAAVGFRLSCSGPRWAGCVCAGLLQLMVVACAISVETQSPAMFHGTSQGAAARQAATVLGVLVPLCFGGSLCTRLMATLPAMLFSLALDIPANPVPSLTMAACQGLSASLAWRLDRTSRQDFRRLQRAERRAYFDQLTGLLNRWGFRRAAEKIERHARRERRTLAVVLLDLDHFKLLNDVGGHAYGDEVLARIGDCLERFVRRPLDVCARYGGEEFVLLWYETEASFAAERGRLLVQVIEALQLRHPGTGRFVTASAGIAHGVPDDRMDLSYFLATADRQLYRAKRLGRNRAEGPDEADGSRER